MSTDEAERTSTGTPEGDARRARAEVERSSAANGAAAAVAGEVVTSRRSNDPAAIEAEIARRREHLAATVDELAARAHPKALAAKGVEDARSRLQAAVLTPSGELRTERVAAVAGALAVLVVFSTWMRRRRRKG